MDASHAADVTAPNQIKRMMLAAVGVVYGDIGTSPLYTLRECLGGAHGLPVVRETVLGLVSLILWALIVVVTIKYVLFIMRIDNRGEGGILALMALAQRKGAGGSLFVTVVGLIGAALFFGDGIITPAISVLSAVEGLEVATPAFKPYVIPVALAVLAVLFALQYRGTDKVGGYFGPVMLVWFATLGGLGLVQLIQRPEVLLAFDPRYAAAFFADHGFLGFLALGAVILAVTGGEALYADMGHFGVRPVRLAWMTFVLPALALNYLGQGALVLGNPAAAAHPFYHLAPEWLLLPLVGLATAATIIASQAVISGAFSLTQQAIQLGFCPRMEIRHTSEHQIGQIYMPEVNERLFIGVVALVIIFQSSSNLAAAYGIAVAGTMTATTLLAFIVVRHVWGWRLITCLAVIGPLLLVDLAFLGANAWKVFDGGWVPLALAGLLVMMMTTWRHGRQVLAERLREETIPTALFLERLDRKPPPRVTGTAVYMTRHTDELPNALLHNLKHNKVLHQRVVLLTVETLQIPRVPAAERLTLETPRAEFHHLFLRCGFMETPDIPQALQDCSRFGLDFPMIETSFFLGRETLIPAVHPPMSRWRERLFILLSKNAVSATDFFRIPADRVIELGAQVPV